MRAWCFHYDAFGGTRSMKNMFVAVMALVAAAFLTGCAGMQTARNGYAHSGQVEKMGLNSDGQLVPVDVTKWQMQGYQDATFGPGGDYYGGPVFTPTPPPIAQSAIAPVRHLPPPGQKSYEYVPPPVSYQYVPPATTPYYPPTTTPYAQNQGRGGYTVDRYSRHRR
jgi:hypothetical protein